MKTYRRFLFVAVSAVLIAACADDPLAVGDQSAVDAAPALAESTTPAADSSQSIGPIIDPFTPRLVVDIVADSGLSPTSSITLRLDAVAAGPITGGEVFVTLPTQASMARGFRPTSGKLPVVARWTLPALATGDTWTQRVTVGSVEAGYYDIAVDVRTEGPRTALGPYLVDDTGNHEWLYVQRSGGTLTLDFDDSLFAQGIRPQPGPFRARRAAADASPRASPQSDASDDVVTVKVVHLKDGEYVPAAGAKITGTIQPNGGGAGHTVSFIVPDDGIVEFDCPTQDEFLSGDIKLPANQYVAGAEFRGYWDGDDGDCGETIQVSGTAKTYMPWKNLKVAIPLINAEFGFSRSRVKWLVRASQEYSTYNRKRDRIEFGSTYHKDWTASHEYVHALHHKSLGGLWNTTNCANHKINKVSSYTCAFQEGLADYGANVGAPDTNDPRAYDWEIYDEGEEGTKGKIEGYVAALFHDLLDDTSESGDETDYDGAYVMAVFKSCRTATHRIFSKRNDVSDFVWCLENRVNKNVHNNNFPGITAPKHVRESASEPSDWSADDIRATWRKNVGS